MIPSCCDQPMTDLGTWPQFDGKTHRRIGALMLHGWRCETCRSLKKTNDVGEVVSTIGAAA